MRKYDRKIYIRTIFVQFFYKILKKIKTPYDFIVLNIFTDVNENMQSTYRLQVSENEIRICWGF